MPGEQPDLDQRQLLILGAVLALLLALLIGFYLRRGNLAVALGLLPASALATAHERRGIQDREAERIEAGFMKRQVVIERRQSDLLLAGNPLHLRNNP